MKNNAVYIQTGVLLAAKAVAAEHTKNLHCAALEIFIPVCADAFSGRMEIIMKKDKKEKQFDKLMFNQAGSANDCTGLIPAAIQEKEELRSYEDMYNFSVPESVKEDID